jgi:hypothetical protein
MNDEIGMACSTHEIITAHRINRMTHYPLRNNEIMREWAIVQIVRYNNKFHTSEL